MIVNGLPGTSMPAWRDMPQKDVEALVVYLTTLHQSDKVDVIATAADLEKGKTLFAGKCISCHGSTGDGNGVTASALARCPTNFHEVQPNFSDAMNEIKTGIPGTGMPPWGSQLTEDERRLLVLYVRSLYEGDR
jgi:mono/diheme cytochrome c family protein